MNPLIQSFCMCAIVISVGNIFQIRVARRLMGETLNTQIYLSWGHWFADSANHMRASGRIFAYLF